jgi:hypothetical protein
MDNPAAVPDDDIVGDAGEVLIAEYATSSQEARKVAELIQAWINEDGLAPSDIAVLVRHQAGEFAGELISALDVCGIASRNEQQLQDDFAEPLGRLILDFLAVTIHHRQPEAYRRLMVELAPITGDDESDHQATARWDRYIRQARSTVRDIDRSGSSADLIPVVEDFIAAVGRGRLAALSPGYVNGTRLNQLFRSILLHLSDLTGRSPTVHDLLSRVTDDGFVRVLTIHKAKGLEFDAVVVLGVETQTFWSKDANEARSEFFVAISRARHRLLLTTAVDRTRPPRVKRWINPRTPHFEFLRYAETANDSSDISALMEAMAENLELRLSANIAESVCEGAERHVGSAAIEVTSKRRPPRGHPLLDIRPPARVDGARIDVVYVHADTVDYSVYESYEGDTLAIDASVQVDIDCEGYVNLDDYELVDEGDVYVIDSDWADGIALVGFGRSVVCWFDLLAIGDEVDSIQFVRAEGSQ